MDALERYKLAGSGAAEPHAEELLDKVDALLAQASAAVLNTPEGGVACKFINKTGAASVRGSVVKASTTTDNAVELAGSGTVMPIGVVWESGVADGEEVWVVTQGKAYVLLDNDTASTRGNWARLSSAENGRIDATLTAPPGGGVTELDAHMAEVGHALESKTAGTDVLCLCLVHFN